MKNELFKWESSNLLLCYPLSKGSPYLLLVFSQKEKHNLIGNWENAGGTPPERLALQQTHRMPQSNMPHLQQPQSIMPCLKLGWMNWHFGLQCFSTKSTVHLQWVRFFSVGHEP